MSNYPRVHCFAVAVDKFLYASLEEYGEDGDDEDDGVVMHYYWLFNGKSGEKLCKGYEAAMEEAKRLGWVVYSFLSYEEFVAAARTKSAESHLWESSNLYWVALTIAEHLESAKSKAYLDICKEFAPVARIMGNTPLADDLENYYSDNIEG